MTRAIRLHRTGGPEVLEVEEIELPEPKAGEARVRHHAIGVNFIDTYHRSGLYKLPSLPGVIGSEASGIVEAVGEGVTGLQAGDRVAYAMARGSYAELAVVPANLLVKIPLGVELDTAAACMPFPGAAMTCESDGDGGTVCTTCGEPGTNQSACVDGTGNAGKCAINGGSPTCN